MEGIACERPVVRVRQLLSEEAADLGLSLRAGGSGLDKEIFIPRIQKPGLALAGFMEYIHPGRVQILGQSEITFLEELAASKRRSICTDLCSCGPACFVITKDLAPPPELVAVSDECGVPLLVTAVVSSELNFLQAVTRNRQLHHSALSNHHDLSERIDVVDSMWNVPDSVVGVNSATVVDVLTVGLHALENRRIEEPRRRDHPIN